MKLLFSHNCDVKSNNENENISANMALYEARGELPIEAIRHMKRRVMSKSCIYRNIMIKKVCEVELYAINEAANNNLKVK